MAAERAVRSKKVPYLGRFCYLDNYCVRKSITLIFKSFSTDEFTLSKQNSVTDVCVEFRPSCWCSSVWAPTWRLHTQQQSEARTAVIVWNWSGKTLSPGALLAVLYFSSFHIYFSARLDFPSPPLSAPGSPRMWVTRQLRGGRESCQVKKSALFGEILLSGQSITLMFKSFPTDEFALSKQNSVTDVCVEFRPSCWCSWRLHTKFYNFG